MPAKQPIEQESYYTVLATAHIYQENQKALQIKDIAKILDTSENAVVKRLSKTTGSTPGANYFYKKETYKEEGKRLRGNPQTIKPDYEGLVREYCELRQIIREPEQRDKVEAAIVPAASVMKSLLDSAIKTEPVGMTIKKLLNTYHEALIDDHVDSLEEYDNEQFKDFLGVVGRYELNNNPKYTILLYFWKKEKEYSPAQRKAIDSTPKKPL